MQHRQTLPQIRKAETRIRLLEAARKVFAAYGYESSSVARIAGEAGIAKGGLYVHFESKEQLFKELLLDYVKRRSVSTVNDLRLDMTLKEGLLRILEGAWAIYDEGDPCFSLSTEFFAQAGRYDWGREAMATILDHCSGLLIQFLEHAKARGEVRADLDCMTTAQMMLALHDGVVLHSQNQTEGAAPNRLIKPMRDMILSYIESRETR